MWFPAQVALAREVSAAGLTGADAARAVTSLLYLAGAFVMLESALRGACRRSAGDGRAVAHASTTRASTRACARAWPRVSTVASVFEDTLEAVLDWTFPTSEEN